MIYDTIVFHKSLKKLSFLDILSFFQLWNVFKECTMARVCQVTGKKPMVGNNVSHANNKTKRRFLPNLQNRRIFVESENRWVSLRLSNAGLRVIDKVGIDAVLVDMRARGEKVQIGSYHGKIWPRQNQVGVDCRYGSLLHDHQEQAYDASENGDHEV